MAIFQGSNHGNDYMQYQKLMCVSFFLSSPCCSACFRPSLGAALCLPITPEVSLGLRLEVACPKWKKSYPLTKSKDSVRVYSHTGASGPEGNANFPAVLMASSARSAVVGLGEASSVKWGRRGEHSLI